MSTHAITYVHEGNDKSPTLVAMYRHFDGHIESHGEELMKFLANKVLVNGISGGDEHLDVANGMGDLAAQLICHFKRDNAVGGIYLNAFENGIADEEYIYHIYNLDDTLYLRASSDNGEGFTHKFKSKKGEGVANDPHRYAA